jgi:hypothetical protein
MREDMIGWEHVAHIKEIKNVYKSLVRKPERMEWENNNNMDPKEIGYECGLK